MVANQNHCRDTVIAVLSEAHEAGISALTRTTLTKYVYLLDVYVAEEAQGERKWTELEWIFLNFGPYSAALAQCLDQMESDALIDREDRAANDKEFVLYRLAERVSRKTLKALGVPQNASNRIGQAIREFKFDLPKLLDYVYFRTAPMTSATPRSILRFDTCRAVDYKTEIRPLKLGAPTKQQADRMRQLIGSIHERNTKAKGLLLSKAIVDKHYADALNTGDIEETLEVGPFRATLQFSDDGGENGGRI